MLPILLLALNSLYPEKAPRFGHAAETQSQRQERLQSIAEDLDAVLQEETPVFGGKLGRERTAFLILAVAAKESAFRRDVDLNLGRSERARKGEEDHGKSYCLLQINLGAGKVPVGDETMRSWTGEDLLKDRRKCFRVGLAMMRMSFSSCRSLPVAERLNAYAGGVCKPNPALCAGNESCLAKQAKLYKDSAYKSSVRVRLAYRLFDRYLPLLAKPAEGST